MHDNFCIAPFVTLATTTDGRTRLCCQADENWDFIINDKTVDEVFNSDYHKQARQDILSGKWAKPCWRCKSVEEKGINSRRDMENKRFEHLDWEKLIKEPKIHSLDIRYGNQCNLACVMCSPKNSVTWYEDYEGIEHLAEFNKNDGLLWAIKGSLLNDIHNYLDDVELIYFSGGEPLLNKKYFQLLQLLIDKGLNKQIKIVQDTNGTLLTQDVIDTLRQFKHAELNFSIDGVGEVVEYIRYPIKYETILEKFNLLKDSGLFVCLQPALGAHNLIQWGEILNLQKEYNFPQINISISHWPEFMQFQYITDKTKQKIIDNYSNTKHNRMRNIVKSLKLDGSKPTALIKYFEQIDELRNLNHRPIFPWLYE